MRRTVAVMRKSNFCVPGTVARMWEIIFCMSATDSRGAGMMAGMQRMAYGAGVVVAFLRGRGSRLARMARMRLPSGVAFPSVAAIRSHQLLRAS